MLGPSFLQLWSCFNRTGRSCLAALCGKAGHATLGDADLRVGMKHSDSNPYLAMKTFILDCF